MKSTKLPTLQKKILQSKSLLKSLISQPNHQPTPITSPVRPTDYTANKLKELQQLPNDEYLLNLAAQFQKQCQKYRVEPFYSYMVLSHLKYLQKEKGELMLLREIDLVSRGKSTFNRVTEMVTSRERFVGMMRVKVEELADEGVRERVRRLAGEAQGEGNAAAKEDIYQSIKGLRLLNLEIIEQIQKWKTFYLDIRKQSTVPVNWEPIAWVYKNTNYLIKMISDVDFLSSLQIQGLNFANSNDPFVVKPLKGTSTQTIEKIAVDETLKVRIVQGMDILAREKVEEFRYRIEGSAPTDRKMDKIKSVYQSALKQPHPPKLVINQVKFASSFDEEDEFESLIRRYEKEVLMEIKSKMKQPKKKPFTLSVQQKQSDQSPAQNKRINKLKEEMGHINQLRKDSEILKERLIQAMKIHKEKPLVALVEENPIQLQEPIPNKSTLMSVRSASEPKMKMKSKSKAHSIFEKPQRQKLEKLQNSQKLEKAEKSGRQERPQRFDLRKSLAYTHESFKNSDAASGMKRRSYDQLAKVERQNKIIEELRQRLREAELQKEKQTKYQNYIEARKSKRNSDTLNLKLIKEQQPKQEINEVQKKMSQGLLTSPYKSLRKEKSPKSDQIDQALKRLKSRIKNPHNPTTFLTESMAEFGQNAAVGQKQELKPEPKLEAETEQILQQRKRKQKQRYDSIKKIYSQKQTLKFKQETATLPQKNIDITALKQKIEEEVREKILREMKLREQKLEREKKKQQLKVMKEKERELRIKAKGNGKRQSQAEVGVQKQSKLQQIKTPEKQLNDQSVQAFDIDATELALKQRREQLDRNLKLDLQLQQQTQKLRRKIEQQAQLRQLRLRQQYESQLRSLTQLHQRQSLQLQQQLEKQQLTALQKQHLLALQAAQKQRLQQQLIKRQLREQLLMEIQQQAFQQAEQRRMEEVKKQMEVEMQTMKEREEQMLRELQEQNTEKLERLMRIKEEGDAVEKKVKEQLRKLEEEREIRKEKVKSEEDDERHASIDMKELNDSKQQEPGDHNQIVYTPEQEHEFKQQLKMEILREMGERQKEREEVKKKFEEQRAARMKKLEDQYRVILLEQHKKFQEDQRLRQTELLAEKGLDSNNFQKNDQQNIQASADNSGNQINPKEIMPIIDQDKKTSPKKPNIQQQRLHSVRGQSRQLLKQVDSDDSSQLNNGQGSVPQSIPIIITNDSNRLQNQPSVVVSAMQNETVQKSKPAPANNIEQQSHQQPELSLLASPQPMKNLPIQESRFEITQQNIAESKIVSFELPQKPQQQKLKDQDKLNEKSLKPTVPQQPFQLVDTQQPQPKQKQQDLKQSVMIESPRKQPQISELPQFPRRKQPQPLSNSSLIAQTQQQILRKWQHLRPYIKPTKKLTIQAHNVKQFIKSFIEKQNRQGVSPQMLPYTEKQLNYIFKKKQVDVYPNSFGWRQGDKYILMGSIECLGVVETMYGNIQVEVRMNMNAANPKEKKYFANRLRFLETVGYVYQKRLEDDYFAIKVIIKIPKGLGLNRVRNNNKLNIQCTIEMDGKTCFEKSRNQCSFIYPLASKLINHLTEDQKLFLCKYGENNYISKQLFSLMATLETNKYKDPLIKHTKTETTVSFGLEIPICLSTYPCLRYEAHQIYDSQGMNFYMSIEACPGYILVLIPLESNKIDFDLDTYLKIMKKTGGNKRQTVLWVPLWRTKRRVRVDNYGTTPFAFRSQITPNFDIGSVQETPKGNCMVVKPPFVFAVLSQGLDKLCEWTPLYAEIVKQDDLVPYT